MTLRAQVLTRWPTLPVWTNSRLAKSADYTVANSDKGKTFALTGATFFSLTFSTASGYDANFAAVVTNDDTTRGKKIVLTGGTNFNLMPGQSCLIFNDNNVWKVHGRSGRWKLPSDTKFFIDPAGSDTNDGLAAGSGAFLTQQGAANYIRDNVDANYKQIVVQLADHTWTDQVFLPTVVGANPGGWPDVGTYGTGQLCWRGNLVTPGSCIQSNGTPSIKNRNVQNGWRVEGFTFTGLAGIQVEANGLIYIGGSNVFDCSLTDISVDFKSWIELVGLCATTNRTRGGHIQLVDHSHCIAATGSGMIATGSAPTYSTSFLDVQWSSNADMAAYVVDTSMAGTVGYAATAARLSSILRPSAGALPGSLGILIDAPSFSFSSA